MEIMEGFFLEQGEPGSQRETEFTPEVSVEEIQEETTYRGRVKEQRRAGSTQRPASHPCG